MTNFLRPLRAVKPKRIGMTIHLWHLHLPYKFIDGWYIGSFVYSAFKHLETIPLR